MWGGKSMAKITGNNDGPGGRNETYRAGNRFNVSRKDLVDEVELGLHPDYHIVKRGSQKYVRDNPDRSKSDNVNR